MKAIHVDLVIDTVRSKKDRSLGLSISTPELAPEEKTLFMEMQGLNLSAILTPKDEVNVGEYTVNKEIHEKTPSQRLRAVLFISWKQHGGVGEFDDFYKEKMNGYIQSIKDTLEDEN